MSTHVAGFQSLFSLSVYSVYWRGHQARLSGKVFWDVHGQTSRDLNPEAGLNIILYFDWL